jgi:SAM-dependent methyltransferase
MDEKDRSVPSASALRATADKSAALGSSASSAALVTRLAAERQEAHRRYNEAFTALDRAIQTMPAWPAAPPGYDEQKLPAINDAFNALGRTPDFERQMAFNAALVEHLNRNAVAHRQAHLAIGEAVARVKESSEALITFESRLVQFLQQITPLADAHYREINDAIEQLRTITNVAQRAAIAAQRAGAQGAQGAQSAIGAQSAGAQGAQGAQGAPSYVAFEDRFRGSEDEIRRRQQDYVQYFRGHSDVVDMGCGRGEFLELLRQQGVRSRGIDVNVEMVELCRERGLDVTHADARGYLRSQADQSLGGLIALQVVEHLEPTYLAEMLSLGYDKLRPGAAMVLETINPACWVAFFESYLRDLTHVKPIHPETLQYLLQASGFSDVQIVYRSPIAEGGKLRKVTPRPEHFGDTAPDSLTELVSSFNSNVDRLNARMFSFQDFAAIATKS